MDNISIIGIDISKKMRIPVETDHPFQSKPITDSIPSRSPIPVDADH